MCPSDVTKRYAFNDPSERGYLLFPDAMERSSDIFFHGTAETNLASILRIGFRIMGTLSSVSFAKNSDLSLRYACKARCESSPGGVVIAAKFYCVDAPHIDRQHFGLHVYHFDVQPHIVGYCIVPAEYVYL